MHLPRPSLSMPPALGFSASSFPPQIHQGEVPDIERPTPCNFVVAPPLPPSASLPPSLPLLPPSPPPSFVPPASSSPPRIHQGEVPDIERPTPCNYVVAPPLPPSASLPPSLPLSPPSLLPLLLPLLPPSLPYSAQPPSFLPPLLHSGPLPF